MLTRIEVSNFKSLGEGTALDLGPLTALVGINGSGKSNLVDVPQFVADALREGIDAAITSRGGISSLGRWTPGRPFDVAIRIVAQRGVATGSYELRIKSDRAGSDFTVVREIAEWTDGELTASFQVVDGVWDGPIGLNVRTDTGGLALPLVAADSRFAPLFDELRSVAIYSIFPSVLRLPQAVDSRSPMHERGENWATTLRELLKDETLKAELLAALFAITGDIDDLRVTRVGTFLSPQYRHETPVAEGARRRSQKWFDSAQESDGTLRLTGILTALLQRPSPGLLGVEEPEQTIHPGALAVLHDYLVEASQHGQVIVTTHSPDLLDLLSPETIYVVERLDGVTRVAPLDPGQQKLIRDRLTQPGELLRVEGLHAAA